MLTNKIPRFVRGRIYQYDRFVPGLGVVLFSSMVGVFEGKDRYQSRPYYQFRVLAFDMMPKVRFIPVPCLKAICPRPSVMPFTITEVPKGDMLLFVNYKQHTDLYKALLADPTIDLIVKRKRRARVRRVLQKIPAKPLKT